MPMESHSLEELDRLALGQLHDRLLPGGLPPGEAAAAPRLARHPHRPYVPALHLEDLLDRLPDLVFVGARIDREGHEVLLLATDVALLGDQRLPDHVVGVHGCSPCAAVRADRRASSRTFSTACSADLVITRWRCRSTSRTFSPSTRITE